MILLKLSNFYKLNFAETAPLLFKTFWSFRKNLTDPTNKGYNEAIDPVRLTQLYLDQAAFHQEYNYDTTKISMW